MPVILNVSDCDFWLDVTALGACCEDRASLDPGASFRSPSNWAHFSGDSPPAHDGARHCAIILESSSGMRGQGFDLSKTDSEFLDLEASLAEVRRLRDENARLRNLLIERSIRIPEVQPTSGIAQTPQTIGVAPEVPKSVFGRRNSGSSCFAVSSVGVTIFMRFAGRTPTGDLDTCRIAQGSCSASSIMLILTPMRSPRF
jgi:hypothetical protein